MNVGAWIWQIKNVEGGDPAAIAQAARQMGLGRVFIKIADGTGDYNKRPVSVAGQVVFYIDDIIQPVVDALHSEGIEVWGWHYVYGYWAGKSITQAEARKGIERVKKFGLDGFAVDAEGEYKQVGNSEARAYMNTLRAGLGENFPIGIASFRWPDLHPEFPWAGLLERATVHMPQVYWLAAHNAGDQLRRSYNGLMALKRLPFEPIGSCYYDGEYKWRPTVAEMREFYQVAVDLGITGLSWWAWDDHGIMDYPEYREAITSMGTPVEPPPPAVDPMAMILAEADNIAVAVQRIKALIEPS